MNFRVTALALVVVFFTACSTRSFSPDEINLIPKPNKLTLNEQSFKISNSTKVKISNKEQQKAVDYLNGLLNKAAGFQLETSANASSNVIAFVENKQLKPESYTLDVTPKQITIAASNGAGWFYGVQSIRQLLPEAIEAKSVAKAEWLVPCVSIEDAPRFGWRGMHMDFSRHFFNIDEVKQFLDYMALYKLNTYHMHLTDDQGWRIEIKKYPLLTEKGAWRVESSHDKVCKDKAKTNETFIIDPSNYHQRDGKKMYGGFFTQEQIREIVKYAGDRYITVVPEIDIPGHFKAAIDNYPYLTCNGKPGWGRTFSIPACLGKETTYDFIKEILSEVADLFPGQYIHIGGDEVNTTDWKTCKKCQAVIRKNKLKNEHELQSFFNRDIEKFLHSKGKRLMGWDEIVEGGLTSDASMMWWRNWAPKMRNKAANNGNDMVISPDFEYYFDFMNEATPLKKVYNYEPVPAEFTPEQEKHIIGIQANLWSEWIPNFKRLQIQTFPRMLALAETAWNKKGDKDFDAFHNRVKKHYKRLDVLDINYYIPPIKGMNQTYAFVDSAVIKLDIELDNAEIYYTLDGTAPTRQSTRYTQPIVAKKSGKLLARAYKNQIAGEVYSAKIDKQDYRKAVAHTPKGKGFNRIVQKGKFKSVEAVSFKKGLKTKVVDKVDMAEYNNTEHIAFEFTGYFKADKKGIYDFSTTSDDGSLLFIGDKLVVDNGGNHAPRKRSGMIALLPGYHPITIRFHQGGGGGEVAATIKVPAGEAQPLNGQMVTH
jgi:hexosaminidase